MEINQLIEITDVTARVTGRDPGLAGEDVQRRAEGGDREHREGVRHPRASSAARW